MDEDKIKLAEAIEVFEENAGLTEQGKQTLRLLIELAVSVGEFKQVSKQLEQ